MTGILAPNGDVARRYLAFRQSYEGAETGSTHRNWLMLPMQDAEQDVSKLTRKTIASRARQLWRNSLITRGLIERMVTYIIGANGVMPRAASSDAEWNRAANRTFKKWCKNANLQHRYNYTTTQRLILRARLIDGDIASVNTFGPSGRPRIQTIEAQRICTDPEHKRDGDPDGIRLDRFGRPERFTFSRTNRDGRTVYHHRDARDVILHWHPERSQQYRGMSLLAPIIKTDRDMHEIIGFEKIAVKEASAKTDIIKTETGELNATDALSSRYRPTGNSVDTDQDRLDYYQQSFGPEAKVIKRDDDYTPYVANRPGPAWQGFMDFLSRTICIGANLPPNILLPIKMGGADTRKDLAAAERVFKQEQDLLSCEFQRHYEHVIRWEMEFGDLASLPAPSDWREAAWKFPRAITADYGREAQQDRMDVEHGTMSREEYFGRLGKNAEDEDQIIVNEAKRRKEMIEAGDMTVAEFKSLVDLTASTPDPVMQSESGDVVTPEDIGEEMDNTTKGVRGGVITSTPHDEEHFRAKIGLPPMSKEAVEAWEKEGNIRRPITLTQPGGDAAGMIVPNEEEDNIEPTTEDPEE